MKDEGTAMSAEQGPSSRDTEDLVHPSSFILHPSKEPIGIIAGWGRYPIVFAEKAREMGIPVVCVGVRGMADKSTLAPIVHRFYWTRLGSMSRPIKVFKREGVRNWVWAGKIHKISLFKPFRWLTILPDWRMIRFWFFRSRKNNADDTLAMLITEEYAKEGLICSSALELCPELLVKPGVATKRQPTEGERRDIAYGWELAKEMGRLDIGQSVMVREQAVLAVEAIEGTDRAIQRAGELCHGRAFVVVKVAKPQQDMRFDVPTIGISTIEMMKKSGAKVLAVEAGKTIVLDQAETIALADRYGITVVAQ